MMKATGTALSLKKRCRILSGGYISNMRAAARRHTAADAAGTRLRYEGGQSLKSILSA